MRRFFIPLSAIHGEAVTITGSDAHHLIHVLRKSKGDRFEATDGQSRALVLEITEIRDDSVLCRILSETMVNERSISVRLFQALPKNPAWEDILIQSCELGVSEIVPLLSERTIYPSTLKGEKKERWQRLILESSKKIGKTSPTILHSVIDWHEIPKLLHPQRLKIMPWELEHTTTLKKLLSLHSNATVIDLLIGPEGGFSQKEASEAKEWGFFTVSLGKRILTTRTAVISTLSCLYFSLEDNENSHPQ
jgi:16S rRNA (uracil1498-N3)-methyltransferase